MSGIQVRGVSGIVANIHAADRAIQARVRATVKRHGEEQRQETEAAAPKRTGFLASHTRLDFSPEGLTYTVGYREEDFAQAGLPPYFYYVILGTSRMPANPYLFNVHEARAARLTADVGAAVTAAVRSIG